MVSLLLEHKAHVNGRAKNGLTSMHLAAQEDHVPVAEILVQYNATIDPQTKVIKSMHFKVKNFQEISILHLDHRGTQRSLLSFVFCDQFHLVEIL